MAWEAWVAWEAWEAWEEWETQHKCSKCFKIHRCCPHLCGRAAEQCRWASGPGDDAEPNVPAADAANASGPCYDATDGSHESCTRQPTNAANDGEPPDAASHVSTMPFD